MSHDFSLQQPEEKKHLNLSQRSVFLIQIIALVEYVCVASFTWHPKALQMTTLTKAASQINTCCYSFIYFARMASEFKLYSQKSSLWLPISLVLLRKYHKTLNFPILTCSVMCYTIIIIISTAHLKGRALSSLKSLVYWKNLLHVLIFT